MKFRPGDIVRRQDRASGPSSLMGQDLVVEAVRASSDPSLNDLTIVGVKGNWGSNFFDMVTPAPDPLPGVPAGYRAVKFDKPKNGEHYLDSSGCVLIACRDLSVRALIVEPLNWSILPKTREVELFEWVVVDHEDGEVAIHWSSMNPMDLDYPPGSATKTGNTRKVTVPEKSP